MSKLPVKLIELKKRGEELESELSQIIKEEELVESTNSRSFRLKKSIGIIAGVIMLFGCLIISLRLDWSFFKSGDIGYVIINLIAYLFVGGGVAAIIRGLFDLFQIEFLIAKFKRIPNQEYTEFKARYKTLKYKKYRIEQELGVINLRIKKYNPKK